MSIFTLRGVLAAAPALSGAVLYSFGFWNAGTASFSLSLVQTTFLWRGRLWPIAATALVCGVALFAASLGLWIGFTVDRLTFENGEPRSDIIRSTYWWSLILGFLVTAVGLTRAARRSPWALVPPIVFLSIGLLFIPALSYWVLWIIAGWTILNFAVLGIGLLRLVR